MGWYRNDSGGGKDMFICLGSYFLFEVSMWGLFLCFYCNQVWYVYLGGYFFEFFQFRLRYFLVKRFQNFFIDEYKFKIEWF